MPDSPPDQATDDTPDRGRRTSLRLWSSLGLFAAGVPCGLLVVEKLGSALSPVPLVPAVPAASAASAASAGYVLAVRAVAGEWFGQRPSRSRILVWSAATVQFLGSVAALLVLRPPPPPLSRMSGARDVAVPGRILTGLLGAEQRRHAALGLQGNAYRRAIGPAHSCRPGTVRAADLARVSKALRILAADPGMPELGRIKAHVNPAQVEQCRITARLVKDDGTLERAVATVRSAPHLTRSADLCTFAESIEDAPTQPAAAERAGRADSALVRRNEQALATELRGAEERCTRADRTNKER
ncbi:hypothetical protein [Streptomyces yangpuensis]|uniref:hypothetical protein n=1 Tax=Streptomyces yangpuensis TaxID=1648182 RepID=UPI0037162791